MEITKENLEELRKDPAMRILVEDIFGLDLNKLIDDTKLELEQQERIKNRSKEIINEMRSRESNVKNNTKSVTDTNNRYVYETPKVEKTFLMNYAQFEKFVKDYSGLVNAVKKLDYLFGISFNDNSTGFSIIGKVNEIIWDLIGIIFGDENREDIADYIYGNSNFDSIKDLYEELV